MTKRLRLIVAIDGPRYELDGALVSPTNVRLVPLGGGVWIDDEPVFDVAYYGQHEEPLFNVPAKADCPDWYERLESDTYALVDWNDEELVRSQTLLELERLRRHPGAKAGEWASRLRRVIRILEGNATELRDLLVVLQDEPRQQPPANGVVPPKTGPEFERLLHNALAAMKTRVDLMRGLLDDWPFTDEWLQNYATEKDRLIAHDVIKFFHELRNYVLHNRLPEAPYHVAINEGATMKLVLPTAELLKTHRWGSNGRYLKNIGDHLILSEALDEYMTLIAQFDRKLLVEFRALVSPDLADLARAEAEFHERHPTPTDPPTISVDLGPNGGITFSPPSLGVDA